MRRSWPVHVMAAGSLGLLVTLYLPWQQVACEECDDRGGVFGLLDLFSGSGGIDGWESGVGEPAALTALLLGFMAVVAWWRPHLAGRLPLGPGALLAGYFTLSVFAMARSVAHQQEVTLAGQGLADLEKIDFHYAYGAYVGVAIAIAILVAAGARPDGLVTPRSHRDLALTVLAVGLLGSLLLPWERFPQPATFRFLGIVGPPAVIAGALALCLLWQVVGSGRISRVVAAAVTALFTVAAFTALDILGSHAYGSWLGVAFAIVLVVASIAGRYRLSLPRRPSWRVLATAGGVGLLLTALFLPWQRTCFGSSSEFGPLAEGCYSTNGWTSVDGTVAAALAVAFAVAALAARLAVSAALELSAGAALLVVTAAVELTDQSAAGIALTYGAGMTVGLVATAVLVVLALAALHRPTLEPRRAVVRMLPIAACIVYLAVVVLPWWDVLPDRLQAMLGVGGSSWLAIAGVLVCIRLLGSWTRWIAGPSDSADWLVLLPLVLAALAVIDLIRLRGFGLTWGGGIVLGLALLLALVGRIEQRQGLEGFRIPEVLRVDRL